MTSDMAPLPTDDYMMRCLKLQSACISAMGEPVELGATEAGAG